MKDERITLETAKLLKEKNFSIPVHESYTEYLVDLSGDPDDDTNLDVKKGEIEINTYYFKNNDKSFGDYSCKNYTMYAAPSQSLVQRWLREYHNIQLYVYSHTKTGKDEYRDYVAIMNGTSLNDPRDEQFQTYELALEFGITEALKSIE